MKLRLVRCSGKTVRGAWKGERCQRQKGQKPDRNDNTRIWWCQSHAGQRKR